jgi:hypothetical protein
MTPLLTDRYRDRLAGVLSCYDRIVITGTLPGACFAEGMTKLLRSRGIRIFDYPAFAAELRDRVRAAAGTIAAAAGVTIEHIAKSHVRKEAVIAKILAARGDHPGLVLLPGARRVPARLSLELDAGRIFHRPRLPLASYPEAALRTARPAGRAQRQGRTRRHLPRP